VSAADDNTVVAFSGTSGSEGTSTVLAVHSDYVADLAVSTNITTKVYSASTDCSVRCIEMSATKAL